MPQDSSSRSNSREEGILSEFVTSERLFAGDSLILTELSHRISNEFASAISTVSLAAARSDNGEVKAALAVVIDRLHNYASFTVPCRCRRTTPRPTHRRISANYADPSADPNWVTRA